ncbi:hypothetical protein ACMFMG_004921 [Clarireedia jacksonii]
METQAGGREGKDTHGYAWKGAIGYLALGREGKKVVVCHIIPHHLLHIYLDLSKGTTTTTTTTTSSTTTTLTSSTYIFKIQRRKKPSPPILHYITSQQTPNRPCRSNQLLSLVL